MRPGKVFSATNAPQTAQELMAMVIAAAMQIAEEQMNRADKLRAEARGNKVELTKAIAAAETSRAFANFANKVAASSHFIECYVKPHTDVPAMADMMRRSLGHLDAQQLKELRPPRSMRKERGLWIEAERVIAGERAQAKIADNT